MITVEQRRQLMKKLLQKMEKTIEAKSHDYGNEGWQDLGLRGNFADIHKKYVRLKEMVWRGVRPHVKESIQETYLDLANYAVLGLILIEAEHGKVAEQNRSSRCRPGKYVQENKKRNARKVSSSLRKKSRTGGNPLDVDLG